ncbi:hypothetical protein IQ226_04630 [Dolichospermum sp. LEGE 00240]|uniref:hypothetical protein n=1 Tax=Dolichospermum sp. LEGE 00240 TaxID=1828603 RepID=UPI00187F0673|nr:hypothetical protein [Dolichospermum sp. LEGE 00240]MBE9248486.1 hypothetical protein [Dolichospermum sp. LEGE 00240]MDM3844461.1 hypothetical protein [Aphanizomenon gracile PMC638.10]MDM3851969.1 hypothetical protein [Aphanizomenon gracile PMC627.10]MDM3857274.1 hypothetical protein [Aphanizomenon gracile PMC649.10]
MTLNSDRIPPNPKSDRIPHSQKRSQEVSALQHPQTAIPTERNAYALPTFSNSDRIPHSQKRSLR